MTNAPAAENEPNPDPTAKAEEVSVDTKFWNAFDEASNDPNNLFTILALAAITQSVSVGVLAGFLISNWMCGCVSAAKKMKECGKELTEKLKQAGNLEQAEPQEDKASLLAKRKESRANLAMARVGWGMLALAAYVVYSDQQANNIRNAISYNTKASALLDRAGADLKDNVIIPIWQREQDTRNIGTSFEPDVQERYLEERNNRLDQEENNGAKWLIAGFPSKDFAAIPTDGFAKSFFALHWLEAWQGEKNFAAPIDARQFNNRLKYETAVLRRQAKDNFISLEIAGARISVKNPLSFVPGDNTPPIGG